MNLSHAQPRTLLRCLLAVLALAAAADASADLTLYPHDDFQGRPFRTEGATANLARVDFNDRASSLVVRRGTWQLCSDADFRGQCVMLGPGRYPSLRAMGLNDRVSSVRPQDDDRGHGAVELFEHADFNGRSISSAGSPNLARQNFNDRVSSVIVRSGRWEFCSDADFRGQCVVLGPGRYPNLRGMNLNDALSSLRPAGRGGRRD